MAIEKEEGMSTAESLRQTRTYGKFRCHNPTCMERIQPEKGNNDRQVPDMRDGVPGPLGQSHPAPHSRSGMGCKPKTGRSEIKGEGGRVICR